MSNLPQRGSLTEALAQLLCIERHRSTHGGYCANCLSVVENRWLPQLPQASTSVAGELDHDGVWDLLNTMNERGEVPEASGWDADGRPVWLWLNEHGGDEVYMYAARLEIEDGAVTSKAVEIDPDEDMRYPVTVATAAASLRVIPDEMLIRAAYALLLASATTHTAPTDVARWRRDREAFMVTVQRQILSKGRPIPPAVGDTAPGGGGDCG